MRNFLLVCILALAAPVAANELKVALKGDLLLVGIIGSITATMDHEFAAAIQVAKENNYRFGVIIDSPGGLVKQSANIAMHMHTSGLKVRCEVGSMAASGAFYILQACHTRVMHKKSILMWHKATLATAGTIADILTDINRKKAVDRALAVPVCGRMKIPLDACMAKYANGDWFMDAEEAIANNAIDEILD